jgi:2-dehydrotetronate isomerase
MPRFAANLSTLFTDRPFLDRFEAARRAGFTLVEMQFPYEHAASDIAARLEENGLTLVLFNLPPGDLARGERGMSALAGREDDFRRSIDLGLGYADRLGCRLVHLMAGIVGEGERARAFDLYVENLARAAPIAAAADLTFLLEPINSRDIPGYLINRTSEARRAIEAVGSPNIGLQLDLYHRQVMEGDLAHALVDNLDIARHVQIAGAPERHEPDLGEIAYPYLLERLDNLGYAGVIGAEYFPKARTEDGLGWLAAWQRG